MGGTDSAAADDQGTIAATLATIVDRYGVAALFKRDQIELLLRQESPDATKEIGLVLTALAEDVPQRLLSAHGDEALRSLMPALVERLARHPEFDQTQAAWAVRTWAMALALPVVGLASRPPASAATPTIFDSLAAVVTPLAGAGRVPTPVAAGVTSSKLSAPEPTPSPVRQPSPPPFVAPAERVAPAAARAPTASAPPEPRSAPSDAPPPAVPMAVVPIIAAPRASSDVPPDVAPVRSMPRAAHPVRTRRSFTIPLVAAAAVSALVLVAVGFAVMRGSRQTTVTTPEPRVEVPAIVRPVTPPIATVPREVSKPSPAAAAPMTAAATSSRPAPAAGSDEARSAAPVAGPTDAVPSSATGPTIGRVELPRLAKGRPFEMTIASADRGERVATIEYRIVRGYGARSAAPVVVPFGALARTPAGASIVPVAAIAAAGRASMEITLVDRAGVRGPVRKVDLYIAPETAEATLVAARSAPACARATCGSVVSVRSLDGTGTTESIVRMDDREIQTVRQAARWSVGSRVQKIGERYVLVR